MAGYTETYHVISDPNTLGLSLAAFCPRPATRLDPTGFSQWEEMMDSPHIHAEFGDHLLRIGIDRPSHKNAVNLEMMRALAAAIDEAERLEYRVIRISPIGEDFAIGRDHHESKSVTPKEWVTTAAGAFAALNRFSGISVAEVKGMAFGFGGAFATTADICVAGRSARFAFDEVPKGFPPKLVMGGLLGRLSARVLIDLVATGRSISAAEAQIFGIASQVVDDSALEGATDQIVSTLLRNDWAAVKESKRFIREIAAMDQATRQEHMISSMLASLDR